MVTPNVANRPLTQKQESFCLYLFQGLSQRESYIKAGYSSNQTAAVLDKHACELANSGKILGRLAELRQKAEDATISTVVERKQRLTTLQRANLLDFINVNGEVTLSKDIPGHEAIREYSVTEHHTKDGRTTIRRSIKLTDPITAIAEHNRMERIGQPDTVINNLNDNRSLTIIVDSDEGRRALESLQSGKLPQLRGADG